MHAVGRQICIRLVSEEVSGLQISPSLQHHKTFGFHQATQKCLKEEAKELILKDSQVTDFPQELLCHCFRQW